MEETKYQGKMFAIIEQTDVSNGKQRSLEIARRAPGVRLIIQLPNDSLLLTKEHRSELNSYDMRLPGGKVCDSLAEYLEELAKGEDLSPAIEKAARLEAKEEAGVDAGKFEHIHTSIAGLTVDWTLHYFVVREPVLGTQELGEHEDIAVVEVTREDAQQMCLDGRIGEERSALVLLRYLARQG